MVISFMIKCITCLFAKSWNPFSIMHVWPLVNIWKNIVICYKNAENIPLFNIKHNCYKKSFFPSSIIEWNNLDPKLCNSENFGIFKNNILRFIRPKPNSFFNSCNLQWIRLITRLRLELSYLRELKFKYNFRNCLNPLCSCGSVIKSTSHFLLHCPIFYDKRHTLLSALNNIDSKILEFNDSHLTQTLLLGSTSFDSETNMLVLNATINPFRSTFFFDIPSHLRFSVPGGCDFLVYCVILNINTFIWKKNKKQTNSASRITLIDIVLVIFPQTQKFCL